MTRPYELLARFNAIGGIAGVSVRTIEAVNGKDYESDPTPLSSATDPAFTAFASQFSAAIVAERDALLVEKSTLTTTLGTRTTERDGEKAAKEAALVQVESLNDQLTTVNASLTEANAAKSAAEAALAPAEAARDAALLEVTRLAAELEAIKNPIDTQGFPILTAVQLRLGILGAGMSLDSIDAAITSITDPLERVKVQTYWQYATQFERSNPMILGMSQLLGLTTEQVDSLWRSAGLIQ